MDSNVFLPHSSQLLVNSKKKQDMINSLNQALNPQSIAIIGASETTGKLAERRTRSLIEGDYKGKIFLINPNRKQLFNRPVFKSILEVSESVDLVLIVIPRRFVKQAVIDCVAIGVKAIILMSAGFGEVNQNGKDLEEEILSIAKEKTIIFGPNANGLFSATTLGKINMLGVPEIKEGPLSVFAQSGNIIITLTHYAQINNTGFCRMISAGNARGLKKHELLTYLGQDEKTKVILLYLEEIREGDKFVQVAREVSKIKPIIVLKPGQSQVGARAAFSHTGSLTGNDRIVDAALKQAGIIRVFNVDELFEVAFSFSNLPPSKGVNVAILSEGGGDYSVAADNAYRLGLEIPTFSSETQDKIKPLVLEGVSINNPVDYGASAEEHPEDIYKIAEIVMKEENEINSIFITGFFGGYKNIIASHIGTLEENTAKKLSDLMRKYKKPIVIHSSFANETMHSLSILRDNGIFITPSSNRGMKILAYLTQYYLRRAKLEKSSMTKFKKANKPQKREQFQGIKDKFLLETETREFLQQNGIKMPPAKLATTFNEAIEIAKNFGFPVALNIVAKGLIHKSDVGGVKLQIESEQDLIVAFKSILNNVQNVKKSQIKGVLVSPMAPKGIECIIGMARDDHFGPVILFGVGGVYVEILEDVSFRVCPLTDMDLDEMIQDIKMAPILNGIRGSPPFDKSALKEVLIKVAKLAINYPQIQEIDLNPVIVHEKGVSIVDSRIILTQ